MIALDLFAGTGWGVACQRLGIEELGVEIMPEAVATRAANGMRTIYYDVWEGLEYGDAVPEYDMLIASPPCQTFSMAGGGAGRRALDEVLKLIDEKAAARGERPADEPAPTMTSKADRNLWEERPAFTVTGGGSATGGAEVFGRRAREAMGNPERVTVEEAAALQSYPAGFEWCGTKTKRFLQIGNAVPPLMAEAILKAATS